MKRVLSVASEAVPLIKTGGLADVVGALPEALAGQGWQMRVMLPAYRGLLEKLGKTKIVWADDYLFGGPGRLHLGKFGEMEVMALEAPHLYDRDGGPYSGPHGDYWDNAERFAALCWAAAMVAREGAGDWRPDVLHAHDWQGALAPAYLRYAGASVPTVITIHNMAFQGRVGATKMGALRLPPEAFHRDGFEFWGDISTLKAGLTTADAITTVSPRYAEELMRGEYGQGLEGVIAARSGVVMGILNGIDETVWDPENDPDCKPFSANKLAGKSHARKALQAEFQLEKKLSGPLAILVSRLTAQKGIDLLPAAVEELVAAGGGLALLGSGDHWAENMVRDLALRYPGRVGVHIGYNENLSHRMFAGGDAVLVPSRFEPCGLTQLYGLRYGCVPLVAAVGGLADTVVGATPASLAAKAATGVVFHPVDDLALRQATRQLCALYADRKGWAAMVKRGMKTDLGWGASAARYAALYERLLAQ
ncbi:starch synthase [Rhodobacter aestuarii]|uniref:Glycogen synthase n=1 Tax=Rhodobacter aestuarii TaxID=453582 RepID=A0A1N7JCD1_9RHOB|nr:glycogen synthase GlgA [Rhodobacter aestuarii]PTV96935.1 starch synthase [Rhodobacter aestuarii]SIS47013.1 starch synthase [Rhodobacter aestuarii]